MAITRKITGRPIVKAIVGPMVGVGEDEEISPDGYLLLETGDKLILEDGLGNLLLEG